MNITEDLINVLDYLLKDGKEWDDFQDNPRKEHIYIIANRLSERLLGPSYKMDWSCVIDKLNPCLVCNKYCFLDMENNYICL